MPDKGQSSHARNKDGVIKLLKSVNLHKATGLDNLPAHFLNNWLEELSPFLSFFFQLSIDYAAIW